MKQIILVALVTMSLTATAQAQGVVLDLGALGTNGFLLSQADPGDGLGRRASGAGDFNGDGFADLVVGAYNAESPRFLSPDANAGEVYIVFGGPSDQDLVAGSMGGRGVTIFGGSGGGLLGSDVSGAGDVNGDGIDDVIIGAFGENELAGAAYVLFGSLSPSNHDFGNFLAGDPPGFRIEGAPADSLLGATVSGAGDVNGDGLDDVVVGAGYSSPGGITSAGSAYVIFGKLDELPVDVGSLGDKGFAMHGTTLYGRAGQRVSGAGDVNGDGLRDVIVGERGAALSAGSAYVVYGKADSSPVMLETLAGTAGFAIGNATSGYSTGSSVAAAGDVNRDGFADVIVGAPLADPMGLDRGGEAYLIFGGRDITSINLGNLGSDGIIVSGHEAGLEVGHAASGAGDLLGSGYPSVLFGTPYRDAQAGSDVGTATAFPGHTLHLDRLLSYGDSNGLTLVGPTAGDRFGSQVSGAGDINGDGRPDVIIGSIGASRAAAVFNPYAPSSLGIYVLHVANGDPHEVPVGVTGDGSDEGFPAARAWLDFGHGGDLLYPGAKVDVTLFRSVHLDVETLAEVMWRIQTTRSFDELSVRFRYLDTELATTRESAIGVFHSPDGVSQFSLLPSTVDPERNEVTALATEGGFFVLGDAEAVFHDGFEPAP